ncbi:MAG TPA: nucleotide pyrophosphohydrolase [Candidatus Bathyarchaeia archaeon]|nr:nucleotide pyrophosphohydrolase [Candidatus Bathyarchaeia archaeon]
MINKYDLRLMQKAVIKISKDRDWEKFHSPKNMALDIVREVGEMVEHLVWDSNEEIKKDKKRIYKISHEMADVLHGLLLLADSLKIDLSKAFWEKIKKVKKRYPVDQFKGISGYACKRKLEDKLP